MYNDFILADRGTWLNFKNRGELGIVAAGDKALFNQYGVILVNPAKHAHVKAADGQAFIDWIVSPAGLQAIADYKIGGEQLFFPNACRCAKSRRASRSPANWSPAATQSWRSGAFPAAAAPHEGESATLKLGGETVVLRHTDAHFRGDAIVHLPQRGVIFSGDLVYVDRILGVLPWSSVAKAQRETGDYNDFLADTIGKAAKDMEPMNEVLSRHTDLPAFRHPENYRDLHRANMNRAFTEFEAQ